MSTMAANRPPTEPRPPHTESTDERALTSRDFPLLWPVLTRWADNDMFGHLNNAVYYQLFDTAINGWVRSRTGMDFVTAPVQAVVAESGCRYFSEIGFPEPLAVGVAVTRLGRTSVTYRLGAFATPEEANEQAAYPIAALGHWVHVYVDRETRRPVPIPPPVREVLAGLAG
jgi:acyl-CoA thioester hydrolase